MKPTQISIAAQQLGFQLQLLNWNVYKADYAKKRPEVEKMLEDIGLPLELPPTADEFGRDADDILGKIIEHLEQERAHLGGDCYALTLFWYGYLPLRLVTAAAWKTEEFERLLWILKGLLADLGVEAEYESLKHELDVETQWLAQQSAEHGGSLRVADAMKAALRLHSKIGSLWSAAEKLDFPVKFHTIPYHSVFISYATEDHEFCQQLYDRLSEAGIRVWFAPHDMKPGDKLHSQIYKAIEQYDKLLLVLSEASIKSEWVGTELYKARQRERLEGTRVLFPVRIVPFNTVEEWEAFDADAGRDLAREVRAYFIPDFSNWQNEDAFDDGVTRIVEALLQEERGPADASNTESFQ